MECTLLINKDHLLSPNYIPNDLIIIDNNENNFHKYKDPTLKPMISKHIYPYFLKMQKAAQNEGYNIIIDSGYRSYEYQKIVFNSQVKEKSLNEAKISIAIPGSSEHQSGLAIDVAYIRNGIFYDDICENDKESIWLFNHAHEYGFILRYPKNKTDITGFKYEPWHYRFVGLQLANILYNNNITLEEYYANKEQYSI